MPTFTDMPTTPEDLVRSGRPGSSRVEHKAGDPIPISVLLRFRRPRKKSAEAEEYEHEFEAQLHPRVKIGDISDLIISQRVTRNDRGASISPHRLTVIWPYAYPEMPIEVEVRNHQLGDRDPEECVYDLALDMRTYVLDDERILEDLCVLRLDYVVPLAKNTFNVDTLEYTVTEALAGRGHLLRRVFSGLP